MSAKDLEVFKFLSAVEVFLLTEDKKEVLLIHRGKDRKFLPDYYAGLGGKMDFKTNESPLDTAIREISEESPYTLNDIINIELKAIFTAIDRFGKWIVFDFVGVVKEKKFIKPLKTDEGTLEWIKIENLMEYKLIPDLRYNVINKILFTDNLLWIKSDFDSNDNMISLIVNNEKIV